MRSCLVCIAVAVLFFGACLSCLCGLFEVYCVMLYGSVCCDVVRLCLFCVCLVRSCVSFVI